MTLRPCPHDSEIKQLVARGHWPQSAPEELRAHALGCRSCGDLVLVAQTFQRARAVSMSTPQLPPPGVLWWRAQLRRRNAAVQRINKPILGAQIFALSITLIVAAGFVLSQAKQSWHWLSNLRAGFGAEFEDRLAADWFTFVSQSRAIHLSALFSSVKSGGSLMYLIPVLAMMALLSGFVAYLASEEQ
jgi:hypothetical protein